MDMHKEKVQNSRGEIIEVEVISEDDARILMEKSTPKVRITLQDVLAKGHILLEDFVNNLTNVKL